MGYIKTILEILKNFGSVLGYWFNPELRKKRDRKKDMAEFKLLEAQYRQALAQGDPVTAGVIAKKMKDLRAQYKFVNKK